MAAAFKELLVASEQKQRSAEEIDQETVTVNETIFQLVDVETNNNVSPWDVQSAFLYFWLHASSILNDTPESRFQTLARHWNDVTSIFNGKYALFLEV